MLYIYIIYIFSEYINIYSLNNILPINIILIILMSPFIVIYHINDWDGIFPITRIKIRKRNTHLICHMFTRLKSKQLANDK